MSLLGMALLTKRLIEIRGDRKKDEAVHEAIKAKPWSDEDKRMAHWAVAIMSMGSFKERRKLIVHTAKQWGTSEETTWSVLATTIRFMRGD